MHRIYVIIIFLLSFVYSRSCSLNRYDYCEMSGGKKCFLIPAKTYLDNPQDELPKIKRKYKTRGLIVILPKIARTDFYKYCVYTEYCSPEVQNTSSFETKHIQLKRGPPFINV